MASSSARATPVKAIRTTLATRSSPSIPLSAQAYDPIVKAVLRHRLVSNIFLLSALHAWILASGLAIWARGGFSLSRATGTLLLPFQPWTLLGAFIIWIVAAVPPVVLRKVFLTPRRIPASSPAKLVEAALSKPQTSRVIMVYLLSAAATLALHVIGAYSLEPTTHGDPKLSFFVKSRKHPYYLNGRLLFLISTQIAAALVFSLRIIMLDRFVFCWPQTAPAAQNQKRTRLIIFNFVQAAVIAAIFATLVVPIASFIFAFARVMLPVLYRLPLLPRLLRPFTAHFLRGSWTVSLPFTHTLLLCRAWFVAYTTISVWELSNVLFDASIYQPIAGASATPEPHITLVSGISSSDPIFRYFAYTELKSLASDHSSSTSAIQRGNLFNDQKYNPSPWSHLARESLLRLGHDYQLLLRRGAPPPSPPAPSVPAPSSAGLTQIKATPVPLIRKPVFQSGKQPSSPMKAVVDGLASDGPLAQAVAAGAEAAHIPELFRSVEAVVLTAPGVKEEKLAPVVASWTSRLSGWVKSSLWRLLPEHVARYMDDLGAWWRRERISRVAQTCCLPYSELDMVAVEVLSHLVCASLTEDKYGVVQRDIPKILEAMLSFLSAVEDYHAEVKALYVPLQFEDKNVTVEELRKAEVVRADVASACEVLAGVNDGLKEGVARIVRTFGEKLLAFKFPPRIAEKLQPFLEYC